MRDYLLPKSVLEFSEKRLSDLQLYCREQLELTGPGESPWADEVTKEIKAIEEIIRITKYDDIVFAGRREASVEIACAVREQQELHALELGQEITARNDVQKQLDFYRKNAALYQHAIVSTEFRIEQEFNEMEVACSADEARNRNSYWVPHYRSFQKFLLELNDLLSPKNP